MSLTKILERCLPQGVHNSATYPTRIRAGEVCRLPLAPPRIGGHRRLVWSPSCKQPWEPAGTCFHHLHLTHIRAGRGWGCTLAEIPASQPFHSSPRGPGQNTQKFLIRTITKSIYSAVDFQHNIFEQNFKKWYLSFQILLIYLV